MTINDFNIKRFNMKKMTIYGASILLLLNVFFRVEASEVIEGLKTFDGQSVELQNSKLTHLVFQEIWSSYEGLGEEGRIAELPKVFLANSQQVWVQPGINVTQAQLIEYQGYFPQVKPLVLDRGYHLMRSMGGWDLPLHVILKDGKKVFSGNSEELTAYSKQYFSTQAVASQWLKTDADTLAMNVQSALDVEGVDSIKTMASISLPDASSKQYSKPGVGDKAPLFTAKTMTGKTVSLMGLSYNKPLSLVFLDSLCPMPHFPECEIKIEQLGDLVARDYSRVWLGVVSSFYVNKEVVQQFRDKFELTLPLVFDIDNKIFQSYGVHASPYQIDISHDGSIRSRGNEIH